MNGTGTVSNAVSGTGTLTVNGSLTTGGLAQASLVNNGTAQINGTGTIGTLTGTGNLTIGTGSSNNTVQLTSSLGSSTQAGLTINTGSVLDVGSNTLTIAYGSAADPMATIQGYINGAAAGSLTSSYLATQTALTGHQYGLGYADQADTGNPANLAANTIKIMPTLKGDINLDGTVNDADLLTLLQNYGQATSAWDRGNFEYNVSDSSTYTVGDADLLDILHNYGSSASGLQVDANGALLSDPLALSQLRADGIQVVPEPGTLSLLAIGAAGGWPGGVGGTKKDEMDLAKLPPAGDPRSFAKWPPRHVSIRVGGIFRAWLNRSSRDIATSTIAWALLTSTDDSGIAGNFRQRSIWRNDRRRTARHCFQNRHSKTFVARQKHQGH